MQNSRWSGKDENKLIQLVNEKQSDHLIAAILGRSEKAISIKRSKMGLVSFHRIAKKGVKFEQRAKPKMGKLPQGAQLILNEFIPGLKAFNGAVKKAFGKPDRPGELAGNEEIAVPPSISKTILSDVGISGSITIYNHDGETNVNISGLSPRNAVHILATIISKIV